MEQVVRDLPVPRRNSSQLVAPPSPPCNVHPITDPQGGNLHRHLERQNCFDSLANGCPCSSFVTPLRLHGRFTSLAMFVRWPLRRWFPSWPTASVAKQGKKKKKKQGFFFFFFRGPPPPPPPPSSRLGAELKEVRESSLPPSRDQSCHLSRSKGHILVHLYLVAFGGRGARHRGRPVRFRHGLWHGTATAAVAAAQGLVRFSHWLVD
ncbi:hypothetical protein LY78DRAFT_491534 [Colletotrichum sublineola]|nr:hypothetical protein LY78DRAFT_491534 [Colletotrichum sublineola]